MLRYSLVSNVCLQLHPEVPSFTLDLWQAVAFVLPCHYRHTGKAVTTPYWSFAAAWYLLAESLEKYWVNVGVTFTDSWGRIPLTVYLDKPATAVRYLLLRRVDQ